MGVNNNTKISIQPVLKITTRGCLHKDVAVAHDSIYDEQGRGWGLVMGTWMEV